jgi:hypothetical protein
VLALRLVSPVHGRTAPSEGMSRARGGWTIQAGGRCGGRWLQQGPPWRQPSPNLPAVCCPPPPVAAGRNTPMPAVCAAVGRVVEACVHLPPSACHWVPLADPATTYAQHTRKACAGARFRTLHRNSGEAAGWDSTAPPGGWLCTAPTGTSHTDVCANARGCCSFSPTHSVLCDAHPRPLIPNHPCTLAFAPDPHTQQPTQVGTHSRTLDKSGCVIENRCDRTAAAVAQPVSKAAQTSASEYACTLTKTEHAQFPRKIGSQHNSPHTQLGAAIHRHAIGPCAGQQTPHPQLLSTCHAGALWWPSSHGPSSPQCPAAALALPHPWALCWHLLTACISLVR